MCHEDWQPAGADASLAAELTFPISDGTEMPGWRYDATDEKGVCLLLPDIYGPSPFYHHVAALLAQDGYRTILVDYFYREGPIAEITREAAFGRRSNMDENLCLRDVSEVIDALRSETASGRVAVMGFCLSGTFVFDLTTMREDLATVVFYGFPEGPGGPTRATAPRPIDVAAEFQGPITAFWGDKDNIPLELIERFGAEVGRHDVAYVQHVYPGAGHGFLQGLVEDRGDSAAAHDAWARTLEFLGTNVAVA
jgi:carboxymethylenebutenolidase